MHKTPRDERVKCGACSEVHVLWADGLLRGCLYKGVVLNENRLRIRLRAYDHRLLDRSAVDIVRGVTNTGARVAGPIPLPTKRSVITVLRSPHVNKKSREQFEVRIHSRLIEIQDPNEQTTEALRKLDVPAGVDVEIK